MKIIIQLFIIIGFCAASLGALAGGAFAASNATGAAATCCPCAATSGLAAPATL